MTRDRFGLIWVARLGVVAGFAVMTWGLALRWQIAGRIPASNMYEAMLFLRHSTPAAADAFIASRLDGLANRAFGSLPRTVDARAIVERSRLA